MFRFGFNQYMQRAFPKDDLRPISCRGKNSQGGIALTLIDTLDTLIVSALRGTTWCCLCLLQVCQWCARTLGSYTLHGKRAGQGGHISTGQHAHVAYEGAAPSCMAGTGGLHQCLPPLAGSRPPLPPDLRQAPCGCPACR